MSPATKPQSTAQAAARTAAPTTAQGTTRVGVVESDKRAKTRTVVVAFSATHPKYGKLMRHETALHAHDEKNESRIGDRVEIAPCRPISKTKTWTIVRVVERAQGA